jgi:hypothetical protein
MASQIVRIDEKSHRVLRDLAIVDRCSMQEVLSRALEEYRRIRFLKEANAAYAALRQNARLWKEDQKERSAWDATLVDGGSD